MKRLGLLLLLTASLTAFGFNTKFNHGPYLGAQIGHVNTHTAKFDTNWTSSRFFAGWRFNDNFALEGGFHRVARSNQGLLLGYDLTGKAIVPLAHDFSFYVKAGGDYVSQDLKKQKDKSSVIPLVGLGVGFNLTKGLNTDISYTFGWGWGGISDINYAALGLSYTF